METFKKVGDDLEVTSTKTIDKARLARKLKYAEVRLVQAQEKVDELKAKLVVINS